MVAVCLEHRYLVFGIAARVLPERLEDIEMVRGRGNLPSKLLLAAGWSCRLSLPITQALPAPQRLGMLRNLSTVTLQAGWLLAG